MKWFYVTGCDTGFGNVVVKLLDDAGHGVFAGCFMAKSLETLKAQGKNIVPLQLDVTNEDSVAAAAKEIASRVGESGLEGVVNNAAILVTPGPVEWKPLDTFRKMYEVNVVGMVAVTKSVLPLIRKARGRIVNVASIAGRMGLPTQPAYCASKYAVEGISEVLRRDMLPWGVTVHIVEPGVFPKTGLYDTFISDFEKLWTIQPAHIKEDYGEPFKDGYTKVLGDVLTIFGTEDTSLVPKAMVEALTSARPKYRYRVGYDSKYLITFLSWLHERWQDILILTEVPGGPKTPLPAAAMADGKKFALARYAGGRGQWTALWVLLFVLWSRGIFRLSPKRIGLAAILGLLKIKIDGPR